MRNKSPKSCHLMISRDHDKLNDSLKINAMRKFQISKHHRDFIICLMQYYGIDKIKQHSAASSTIAFDRPKSQTKMSLCNQLSLLFFKKYCIIHLSSINMFLFRKF
jgi:hypothetical protein